MKYVLAATLSVVLLSACGVQHRLSSPSTHPEGNLAAQRLAQEQLDDQAKQPTFEKCRNLTDLESGLLDSATLSDSDKARVLDILLVTLRGALCEQLVDQLSAKFNNSPLLKLIKARKAQLEKITAGNISDILATDPSLAFDGVDVWTASNADVQLADAGDNANFKASGKLANGDKATVVSALLPKDSIKEKTRWSNVEIANLSREKAMIFDNGEMKDTGIKTAVKAAQMLIDIKSKDTSATTDGNKQPQNSATLKYTFDLSDKAHLDACGGDKMLNTIVDTIKKVKVLTPTEFMLLDLKIPDADPMAPAKQFKIMVKPTQIFTNGKEDKKKEKEALAKLQQIALDTKTFESSVNVNDDQLKENANAHNQGFWVIPQDKSQAKQFTFESNHKPNANNIIEFPKDGIVLYSLYQHDYNMTNNNQVEITDANGLYYRIKNKQNFSQKFRVKFDINSAYWFKINSERIAECMENNHYAAMGASRDSIHAYLIYSVFDLFLGQKLALR